MLTKHLMCDNEGCEYEVYIADEVDKQFELLKKGIKLDATIPFYVLNLIKQAQ
jgi:hypothetical protein